MPPGEVSVPGLSMPSGSGGGQGRAGLGYGARGPNVGPGALRARQPGRWRTWQRRHAL